jgi:hypothetical protein
MRLAITALLAWGGIAHFTSALVPKPLPYPEFEMSWNVQVDDAGYTRVLNGTVEQVLDQIKDINPDFYHRTIKQRTASRDSLADTSLSSSGLDTRALEPRAAESIKTDCCSFGFKKVHPGAITEGIEHLRSVQGRPRSSARGYGRVSCSWNTGIFWYNEVRQ